jgi:hypothetical protein
MADDNRKKIKETAVKTLCDWMDVCELNDQQNPLPPSHSQVRYEDLMDGSWIQDTILRKDRSALYEIMIDEGDEQGWLYVWVDEKFQIRYLAYDFDGKLQLFYEGDPDGDWYHETPWGSVKVSKAVDVATRNRG